MTIIIALAALALGVWIGGKLWPRTIYAGMSDEDRAALQDAQESAFNQTDRVHELQRQIAVMTLARDPAQMGALALKAAGEIEDIYVRTWDTFEGRRHAVAAVVRRAVEDALKGGGPKFI